jgi:hypothetical protein
VLPEAALDVVQFDEHPLGVPLADDPPTVAI